MNTEFTSPKEYEAVQIPLSKNLEFHQKLRAFLSGQRGSCPVVQIESFNMFLWRHEEREKEREREREKNKIERHKERKKEK